MQHSTILITQLLTLRIVTPQIKALYLLRSDCQSHFKWLFQRCLKKCSKCFWVFFFCLFFQDLNLISLRCQTNFSHKTPTKCLKHVLNIFSLDFHWPIQYTRKFKDRYKMLSIPSFYSIEAKSTTIIAAIMCIYSNFCCVVNSFCWVSFPLMFPYKLFLSLFCQLLTVTSWDSLKKDNYQLLWIRIHWPLAIKQFTFHNLRCIA